VTSFLSNLRSFRTTDYLIYIAIEFLDYTKIVSSNKNNNWGFTHSKWTTLITSNSQRSTRSTSLAFTIYGQINPREPITFRTHLHITWNLNIHHNTFLSITFKTMLHTTWNHNIPHNAFHFILYKQSPSMLLISTLII